MRQKFLLFFFCCQVTYLSSNAQSLTGLNGLLFTPSAEMQEDGTLILGCSFFDSKYFPYGEGEYDGLAGYVNLTFLPFAEFSFRYTSQMTSITEEKNNFPDRMPSFRIRLLKEKKKLPAIVFGWHDISSSKDGGGAKYFEATYFVFTKNLKSKKIPVDFSLSVGYGSALRNARHHDFKGIFSGIELSLKEKDWISYMLEYDSRYWNTGLKLIFFKKLQIMPVLRNMDRLEGNISYSIQLK